MVVSGVYQRNHSRYRFRGREPGRPAAGAIPRRSRYSRAGQHAARDRCSCTFSLPVRTFRWTGGRTSICPPGSRPRADPATDHRRPAGVPIQVSVQTATGGDWLTAAVVSNSSNPAVAVNASAAKLAPGTYQGLVTISTATGRLHPGSSHFDGLQRPDHARGHALVADAHCGGGTERGVVPVGDLGRRSRAVRRELFHRGKPRMAGRASHCTLSAVVPGHHAGRGIRDSILGANRHLPRGSAGHLGEGDHPRAGDVQRVTPPASSLRLR